MSSEEFEKITELNHCRMHTQLPIVGKQNRERSTTPPQKMEKLYVQNIYSRRSYRSPRSPHISSGSTRKNLAATRLRKSLVTRMTRSTTEVSLSMRNLDPKTVSFSVEHWELELRTRTVASGKRLNIILNGKTHYKLNCPVTIAISNCQRVTIISNGTNRCNKIK